MMKIGTDSSIISSTEVTKHWRKVVKTAQETGDNIYVTSNNQPSVVITDYSTFQNMISELKQYREDKLLQTMGQKSLDLTNKYGNGVEQMTYDKKEHVFHVKKKGS
ncbi:MAG TPA: hypothetical protein DCW31_00425 [Lactobacillus sp.]|nr:hypothetical protein [Lactobacillus sp.]